MKAIVCTAYGSPEVLQIKEVEKPVPKTNEVLIKIHATTATVADFRIRSFTVPISFWIPARLILGILKPKKPILGVELAGEIEMVGSDVKLFKVGDKVFAASISNFGAYAEYICLPERGMIATKPENSSFGEAAALPIGAHTALCYLRKAGVRQGQKVLIYGASGSVGTYAVQLAKYFGAEVTGVCSSANLQLIKSLGADKVLDYTAVDFLQRLETYDIVFVAVDKISFSACNTILKKEGVYVNITAPVKSLKMIWTTITSSKKIVVGDQSTKKTEDLVYLKALVESGALKIVIDRTYNLDQIVEAHRYVELGHKKGNVVIIVSEK